MLNRRQTLSLLALGSSAAATTLAPFALHAQDNGAAPAPQPADAAQPIPPFSRAALGDAVPPGWMHQRLPTRVRQLIAGGVLRLQYKQRLSAGISIFL